MTEPSTPPSSSSTGADELRAGGSFATFPIVGIGASAGGLEAFRHLLGALPLDTGMAFVLVQHLDPHHESILAELLSEATSLEVSEVQGDVRVEPNRVYVIPPSKGLVLVDGLLKLVPRGPAGSAHMPIDSFLRTLAGVRGSQAIGVILSGMGSDGTLGLQAIKGEGGIAFAQDPASARYVDMPRSAIAAGSVDFILTPADIARELTRLGRHPYLALAQRAAPASSTRSNGGEAGERKDLETVSNILELLRQGRGTDFSGYKKTTLRRRIVRRMAVRRIETLAEYAHELETNAQEVSALYEDFLISVTSFFRDPEVFQALSEQVLPALLKDRASAAPVRIWVAGCATGEEVYSIAICLLERTAELLRNHSLQIFATDLSENALVRARDGTYPSSITRDVSTERLRRFFVQVGDRYQINKTVREMCVFARHDLTRDPPYSRMDLISCRNLLIYLDSSLQEVVFATFHYALRPEGFLIVGPAETPGTSSALFATLDEKHRIYSRKTAIGPSRLMSVMRDARPSAPGAELVARKTAGISEVPREVDRMLLARFGPAGVVVDESLRVLEFRGDTDPFLDHGHGKASLNLAHLLRKGLLMELRQGVEKARATDAPVRRDGLRVRYRQQIQSVRIEIIPIKGRAFAERCLLILFETEAVTSHPLPAPAAGERTDAKDGEIERLGQTLAQTTEYMHTLVREHESALEELQASNEETLSNNEELQSLNEELQTAKEEIQSANEELATLNQELQDRNVQLARSNDDVQRGLDSANALVDSMPLPIMILDGDLRVEQANGAFYESFRSTMEQTRGRLLTELGGGQWNHPDLLAALKELAGKGPEIEGLEVEGAVLGSSTRTLCFSARRLHPDRATPGRILLAIEDRTEVKRAQLGREALLALEHEAREKAEAADHVKDQFVATVSHELRGPLTVISGWMNVLLAAGESPDPAVLSRALAAISRGVAAQGRLISDLLDHSRLVTGKVELQRTPIDLLDVAEAALTGVRAAAEAKDIDLHLRGDRATSVVLGDFDRMQQVLWNLFLNAVKFTPRGGSVRVEVGRVDNQAQVTVTDTGRGIPEEFLPRVFERFSQVETSSNRTQPGLGLGLTLVRELVELHGGTVGAASPGKDRGATFTVVLPVPALLLPPPESEWPQPESEPPPASFRMDALLAIPSDILGGKSVLVVDDEVDARDALVNLLERYGARVCSAASVAEALSSLQLNIPDVLITDIGMAGEDGYELIRRVRLLPADAGGLLPLLAVSAYATNEHRSKVMQSGFHKHLEKPVAPAELVTEVARLAGRAGVGPLGGAY